MLCPFKAKGCHSARLYFVAIIGWLINIAHTYIKYEWLSNYPSLFLARNLFSTGQDGRLNTKDDSVIIGKKRCSWERRKEKDEDRERIEKEKDEDAKSLQQAESFTQQRLKYCHGTGTSSHTILLFIASFTLINCEYCEFVSFCFSSQTD